MKIELIGINSSYVHTNLAIRQIKANSKHNINISEYNINMEMPEVLLSIYNKKAGLIGFSCYIWNIEYVLRICEDLKKISPNIIIVLGGPEVSFENQSYDCIDYIITGEGEEAFDLFLDNYFDVHKVYDCVNDLNTLKLYKEEFDKNKIYYYESTRGCPYSCTYCLSGSIGGYREKDIEMVKKEIDVFINGNARLVKFVDRTFNANMPRAKEILKYIAKNANTTAFHFEVALDLFDDEIIEIIKDSNIQLECGVQTTNKTTLKVVNRQTDIERILEYAQKIPKNIHLHIDLIAGLPMESYMSFKKSFNKVFIVYPDNLQLGFLKILKGSQLKKNDETVIYRQYPPYEVLQTDYISAGELFSLKQLEYVFDKYYNKKKALNALVYAIENCEKTPFDFFNDFSMFYFENKFNEKPQSLKNYYGILADYVKSFLNEEYINFLCKLKLDYILANLKEDLPIFADITPDKSLKQCYKEIKELEIYSPHELRNACIGLFCKNPITLQEKNCCVVVVNGEIAVH